MERIAKYQQIILDYLREYAETFTGAPAQVDTMVIADKEQHHYLLLRVGWQGKKFIHFCLFHFDIKDGKIWIQQNETEELIGDELVKRGVKREEIVLGFQPEHVRPHTGFAAA